MIVLLSSCALWWEDRRLHAEYTIPDEGIRTPDQALNWVYANIEYREEGSEYNSWQTPEFTYVHRTGDCEDFALLWMYFVEKQAGLSGTQMVILSLSSGDYHAIGYYSGWYYETTCGWRTEEITWYGWPIDWLGYDEAIETALRKSIMQN